MLLWNRRFSTVLCLLIWIIHSRAMENRAKKLHERTLRLVHPDQSHLAFQQLQMKEKTLSAHPKVFIANTCSWNFTRSRTAWKLSVFGVVLIRLLRISPYSVRMRENTDQNYAGYGHFLPSVASEIFLRTGRANDLRSRYFLHEGENTIVW